MRPHLIVVLALTLLLSISSLAMAAGPGVHFFDCKECHLSGYTTSQLGGANVCLSCHNPNNAITTTMNAGNPQGYTGAVKSDGKFSQGDASNQYGNNLAPVDENSHNWAATSINPSAGAKEPDRVLHPGLYSRYGTTVGKVACSRCHNPHGEFATNPKLMPLSADKVSPMTANATCLACHADFNKDVSLHGLVTHPVGMVYNPAAPGFKAIDNGINGGVALMGDGTVSCTTCHGVHATDSDATTVDGFGVTSTVGAGDGLLLKHNGPGKEKLAIDTGICQACHEYKGHGMSGSPIGCMVCHGGHAYDATAPNYYMLNKQVTLDFVPKTSAPGTVNLNYTALDTDWQNGGSGFCESCHTLPATVAEHNTGIPQDAAFCTSCHRHDTDSGSFGGACNSCHGYAPSQNVAGGPNGYAFVDATHDYSLDANTKDESLTAHAKHAVVGAGNYSFACQECHSNFTPSPHPALDNNYQDVAFVGGLATTGGLNPAVYNKLANGTCATLYCHSDGVNTDRVIAGPIAKTVPGWLNGSTNCASCHNTGTTGTAAVHNTHLALTLKGSAVNCGTCHDDTWAAANTLKTNGDGSIVAPHVDGDVDVVFNTTLVPTAPMNQVAGTCAVYCHSNGTAPIQTPDWDDAATGDCGDCHAVTAGAGLTGNHDTHLSLGFACNVCHTHDGSAFGGDHINGTKDITLNACNACHGATAGQTVGPDRVPVWGNSASVDCETCHAGSVISQVGVKNAPDKNVALSTGHNLASGTYAVTLNSAAAQACTACHDAAAAGHFDGTSGDDTRLVGGFACLTCHDGSTAVQVKTHTNIGATIKTEADFTKLCLDCHDPHGAPVNAAMINVAGVVFSSRTNVNSFDELDAGAGANADDICATCHTNTSHNNTAVTGSHNENADCTSCHGHDGGFMPTGGSSCEDCHGVKLAQPRHAAHINILNPDVDTDKSECAICHPSVAAYTITGGSADHFSNSANDFAAGITNPQAAGTTCSSAMGCHLSTVGDGSWQDTDGLNCNACHYQAADPTQAGNTGDANTISAGHNAHFAGGGAVICTDCHNAVTDTSHISNAGGTDATVLNDKANAVQDEALVVATATFDDGANTCATASCHNNGRPGTTVTTPAWGFDAPNCTQCHLASPTTGSHTKHIPDAADCSTCHTSALKDTSYINSNHYDGNIDVAAGSYPTDKAINSAFTSCTTATCHDDGRSANTTPNWGTTPADSCIACHDAIPATGSHVSHVADPAVACANCHTGAVQSTTAPTGGTHRDGNVNAGSGYPVQPKGSAFTNCTTASCHNDGRNSGVTQNWGLTINNCAECHATVPTTGGHGKHVGVSFAGATIACTDCHAGAVQGTTAPTANHRDGSVNAAGYPVQANGSAFTTCTTASCHQTGQAANAYTTTPIWNVDVANCTQCHAASPTTGSHPKHIVATSATTQCATCHTGAVIDTSYVSAQHGDLNIDVAVGSYPANKALGSAYQSCASISCHGDGLGNIISSTPVWGATAGCAACHGIPTATGSHAVHLTDTSNGCTQCHDSAVAQPLGSEVLPADHSNNNIDVYDAVAGDLGYPTTAALGAASWATCNAASCHDDGTGTLVTTPAWGTTSACAECHALQPATGSHAAHLGDTVLGATIACGTCHSGAVEGNTDTGVDHRDTNIDTVASLGYPQNKAKASAYVACSTVNCHSNGLTATGATPVWGNAGNCATCHASNMISGGHTIHLANGAVCGDCHNGAIKDSNPGTAHIDGNVDAIAGYATANAAYGAGSYTTCNAASCHDNGTGTLVTTPAWGQSAACTECHTTVPATAAHTRHLTQTISSAINCTDCHAGAVWGTASTTTGHRDGDVDVTGGYGYPADAAKGAPYDSCATSYCHGNAMPKGTVSGTTNNPNWGATSTGCTFCHDVSNLLGGTPPAIGAHVGKTLTDCIVCHDNANAAGNGFADVSLHINGILEGGGDSCSDCHSNIGTTLPGAHAAHNNVAYTGLLSNGDYGKAANGWYNVTYTNGVPSFACGYCHPSTVAGHMTKQTSLNPADAGAAGTVKAKNAAGAAYSLGICSATYCHSDGVNVAAGVSPNWATGSISGNCDDCHGNSPTTAAHGVHEVGIHYEELYDDDGVGLMAASPNELGVSGGTDSAHGNSVTSSTITCFTCHKDTVTDSANATNSTCLTCHNDTNSIITGNERARILITSSTHVNGVKDVSFADLTAFKSKAQLRDNLADAGILSTIWNRITGYKAATSRDEVKVAFAAPVFTQGADTCSTVACHNGNAATWSDTSVDCMYCHTSLPK